MKNEKKAPRGVTIGITSIVVLFVVIAMTIFAVLTLSTVAQEKKLADKYSVGTAQIPVAWAIAKGTLPIIGVTKENQVEDAVKAANIALTAEEVAELEALPPVPEVQGLVSQGWNWTTRISRRMKRQRWRSLRQ